MPKVSVIMPLYNAEKYVKQTINSILNQTYRDFELILIDDCGNDNTMNIVREIQDSRIRIIHNPENKGISYSRNVGLENVRGEYIALMDDDDLTSLDRLEIQVKFLDDNPEIGAVGGRMETIDGDGTPIGSKYYVPLKNPNFIQAVLMFYCMIPNGSTMLRRKIVEDAHIRYNDNCLGMEDYNFWIDFSIHGKITFLNNLFLYWRYSEGAETYRTKTMVAAQRALKYAELQKHALECNGYKLNESEYKLYSGVFTEGSPCCVDADYLKEIYLILQKIIYQSKDKENSKEVMFACRKYFLQALDASSIWKEMQSIEEIPKIKYNNSVFSAIKMYECTTPNIATDRTISDAWEYIKKYISVAKAKGEYDINHLLLAKNILRKYVKNFIGWTCGDKSEFEKRVCIVIPVYNAEKYLRKCIESILFQTYSNIEILLIDDGSTDDSGKICNQYAEEFSNVMVKHVENRGAGPARNYAMKYVKGEYVIFLDSDDWLRCDAVQMLLEKMEQYQADVAYFDLVFFDQSTNEYRVSTENAQYLNSNRFLFEKLNNCVLLSTCTAMYRVDAWKKANCKYPECYYEDNFLYPYILFNLPNFVIVPQGLYFYRINTGKSATQTYTNQIKRTIPLQLLMEKVNKTQDGVKYRGELYKFCRNQLLGGYNICVGHLKEEEYFEVGEEFNSFLHKYFPEFNGIPVNRTMYFFGSYNIGRIGNLLTKHDIFSKRLNFASLISALHENEEIVELACENIYRQRMLINEQTHFIVDALSVEGKKVFMFDLLEERWPILKFKSGDLLTGNDYFLDNYKEQDFLVIDRSSLEATQLWNKAVNKFAALYKKYSSGTTFVLVENYLADKYVKDNVEYKYKDISEIVAVNNRLHAYYEDIIKACEGIIVITPTETEMRTDACFKYGCIPEHYSNESYLKIANRISEVI